MNRRKVDLVKPKVTRKRNCWKRTMESESNRQFPSHDRYIKRQANACNCGHDIPQIV